MPELTDYLQMFARLKRAPGSPWSDATLKKAPHKPILLLAVIDLVSRGTFTSPVLSVTDDLVEANELFNGYWRLVAPVGHTSSIAFPFSRLDNEPFWQLLSANGEELDVGRLNITSISQLRRYAIGAKIDDELFSLMQGEMSRNNLREVLLHSHFSPDAQVNLSEQITINAQAYSYSQTLYKKVHQPLVQEILGADKYKPAARDQGFRRIVVKTYEHRCALCGLRIITPEGHTAVDAAHIKPWSLSQNDDIRNGMALCKLCHWAFDRGVVGVSSDFIVITSQQIGADPNVPGLLQTLDGRGILMPADADLRPAQEFLGWHRNNFDLRSA